MGCSETVCGKERNPIPRHSFPAWSVWRWIPTWKPRYVCRHWRMQRKRIQESVELLSTVTGGASTPASFTGMQSGSMAYSKAWTAQAADVTIMPDVKACGPEWSQNCCMTVMIQKKWPLRNSGLSSGGILSATGITEGYVLLMVGSLRWSNDSNTMIRWKKQHRIQNPWGKCVN